MSGYVAWILFLTPCPGSLKALFIVTTHNGAIFSQELPAQVAGGDFGGDN